MEKIDKSIIDLTNISDETRLEIVSNYIRVYLKKTTIICDISTSHSSSLDYYESFLKYKENIRPQKTLSELLHKYMKEQDLEPVLVYDVIKMGKSKFYQIYNGRTLKPSKSSIFAIAIGMHLSQNKTTRLLHAAGYSFSNLDPLDLAIKCCISNGYYDIDKINLLLEQLGLDFPLGNRPKRK
jgi:hypothetical protein